ncbi:MAG: valine--tRNA ligase [Candidatus Uhrbacteria bacterium]
MLEKPEMSKAYEPGEHEDKIYTAWEKSGFFNPDNLPGEREDVFSIMMPPPNVTGVLHLGHAFENSLMDAMLRYQRLCGKKALLVPGTDHAAIATQAKVEKILMQQGISDPRTQLGREGLLEKIREFAEQSKSTILNQIRKVGTSCDWSRLAYTFDEDRNLAVRTLFTKMYEDGLIYRGFRVVNWSVKGQSTCSDDETVTIERTVKFYTFKYSQDFPITIASTRPETKLGDSAVAVHPADVRYQKYIGQEFTVDVGAASPLKIKIIADENADPDFGTGALGVTPAHSPIDFAMYEKQKAKGETIALIPVIGPDGKMTAAAGKDYEGLDCETARAKFVEWLSKKGLLLKEEETTQNVGTSDRYGDVIEAIPMTQWWLDMNKVIPSRGKTLRELMREAVTTGLGGELTKKVSITPERFTKLFLDRVENLRDWCLSRQLWWGHRIPAWYRPSPLTPLPALQPGSERPEESKAGGEGETYVGVEAPAGEGWEQDPDTLDTWFSSGSWTFSTLGWPNKTKDLADYHPTNWMQMGYEILYLWLMRMILMSTYALETIPFKNVYIHGMLRDKDGKKFSKSSGNGIDPIDVIKQYGADALRLSLLTGITPGNDARFYPEKVESARNFVNKIWNIARYVLTTTDSPSLVAATGEGWGGGTLADKWILQRMSEVTQKTSELLESFDFSLAIEGLRDFTWSDFADWYLEISKIQKKQPELVASTDAILLFVLENLLKLWHPFTPFVTETIWGQMGKENLLIVESWPSQKQTTDEKVIKDFSILQEIVVAIRNLRSENKIEPAKPVAISLTTNEKAFFVEQTEIIKTLARVSEISFVETKPDDSISCVVGQTSIYLSLAGLVDKEKEKDRLTKELENVEKYLVTLEKQLTNQEFVAKAPAKVIEGLKQKQDEANKKFVGLKQQLENL